MIFYFSTFQNKNKFTVFTLVKLSFSSRRIRISISLLFILEPLFWMMEIFYSWVCSDLLTKFLIILIFFKIFVYIGRGCNMRELEAVSNGE